MTEKPNAEMVTLTLIEVDRGVAMGNAVNASEEAAHITFDVRFRSTDDEVVGINGKQIDMAPGENVAWELFMHGPRSEGVDRNEVNDGEVAGWRVTFKPVPIDSGEDQRPTPASTETARTQQSDYKLAAVLSAAGCNDYQGERIQRLAPRLRAAPWGSATVADETDGERALAFLDRLKVPDGFVAKSTIVADHSDRMSRWEALVVPLIVDAEQAKSTIGLGEESQMVLTHRMESLVEHRLKASFAQIHGRPAATRFWRFPKQRRFMVGLIPIYDMTYTCIQGMTLWALSLRELAGHPNPYEPLLEIYERGVLVDWNNWRFTNTRLDDLGRIPEPRL